MHRRELLALLFACLCALPAASAWADRVTHDWQEQLEQAEAEVLSGRWQAASETIAELERDVLSARVSGSGVTRLLSRMAVIRALAAAGRGEAREAWWDWQTALHFDPQLADAVDWAAYGEAGRLLATVPPVPGLEGQDPITAELPAYDESKVEPPSRIHAPKLRLPRGDRTLLTAPRDVVVEVVIDTTGRQWQRRIVHSSDDPRFLWSALAALRDWHFEPATSKLDGTPQAVTLEERVSWSF